MNKKENGFSLVIVVIFMSIAALFIGYLMGSWLISFLVEDTESEMAEQDRSTPAVSQEIAENAAPVEDEINNRENNLTAPPTEEETAIESSPVETNVEPEDNGSEEAVAPETGSTEEIPGNEEMAGGFGVQIGAFSNYNNALTVRNEVSELGYQVLVTETSPHQVQVVGYSTRDDAESAAAELEGEGYPGFIVIRE